MPDRIDAPPDAIAKVFLRKPPKALQYKNRRKEPTNPSAQPLKARPPNRLTYGTGV